jgi:hypothetical protein
LLNLRQRTARWTLVARLVRLLSGIDHVTVFHSPGAQEPNKVRNPRVCYAEVNEVSEKDADHRCCVLTVPRPMTRRPLRMADAEDRLLVYFKIDRPGSGDEAGTRYLRRYPPPIWP